VPESAGMRRITDSMIAALPWIEALKRHAQSAREQPDPESVHQLRVAAGRLSVWLRLARSRALRDDLGWLRRSAARVRDLDVLLEHHGQEDWTEVFARERPGLVRELSEALASQRCAGLLQALEYLPELEELRAEERLPQLRERVHAAARTTLAEADPKLDELHTLRKCVRRLRYALEWLGRDSSAAKGLQDSLGDLRDTALALRCASVSPGAGAEARTTLEHGLQACHARMRDHWRGFQHASECD